MARLPKWITLCPALIGTLIGCGESPPPSVPPPADDGRGHERMVSFLAQIQRRTAQENPFLGTQQTMALHQQLTGLAPGDDALRLRLNYELGTQELRQGDTRAAIERFQVAYDLLDELESELTDEQANLTRFQLGVAYLRLGEAENCIMADASEACLIPVRPAGVHRKPEGSSNAIRYLRETLDHSEPDGRLHLTARWLLNIAHMTLGSWPEGVGDEFVIPAAAFEPGANTPRFRNVANPTGLDAFNLAGGVCIDDFDGDDLLDVVTSTWDTGGQLLYFRNTGAGRFENHTREAGLLGILAGLNTVHADYDNDGDPDVLVLRGAWLGNVGRHPNSLLRNDGGTFTDVTFAAGLGEHHYPTQTASWADYDNDGDLDLYIGNESSHAFDPAALRAIGYESVVGIRARSQLFRNEGNGTFTEVTEGAGVSNDGFAKGVIWGDYDADGFPDLYVSNYAGANRLYHNQGDGTFVDVAARAGVDRPFLSFPTWFFDFDNDGHLDLFCSSYSGNVASIAAHYLGKPDQFETALLARGDGQGGFTDVAEAAGLGYPMLPMGANFGDVDSDGFPDIYLGTGSPSYANLMPNLLFLNQGGAHFADVSSAAGVSHLQKGHGVAFADLDQDGDLDLFEQMGGAYPGDAFHNALFENPGFGTNSLTVELEGVRSNRSAIGARIHARCRNADGTERSVFRHVNSGGSFGSSPLRQVIGLGDAERVDTLEIFWPTTGETQSFADVAAGQAIRIVEGRAELEVLPLAPFRLAQGTF